MRSTLFPKRGVTELEGTLGSRFIGSNNILYTNGSEWRRHRTLANPAFKKAMPVKLFGEVGAATFKILDKQYPTTTFTVDLLNLTERMTLDIIGRSGFGFDFKAIEDEHGEWKVIYDKVIADTTQLIYYLFPFMDTKLRWLIPGRVAGHKRMEKFLGMLGDVIDHKRAILLENKHLGVDESERDLLTLMLEGELRGDGTLSKDEMIHDLAIFFVAGHDTSANAMSAAIYWLARHPSIQEKVRQEVNSVLCPDGPEPMYDILPTLEDTKRFVYLNQVIKETLRIIGSVTELVSPRISQDDVTLAGVFIPKGTQVTVNMYELHHNPNVWKDPHTFNPDRFESGGEADQNAGLGLTWTPFSHGTRQCVGMNFSIKEQLVLLAMMVRRYHFSLPKDSIHHNDYIMNNTLLVRPIDLQMEMTKRF
ncbi:cytochrome P-450 cyp509A1 [Hesseltinella vesiculosa]|uniref:Cytochrome P-450 cyp509A1 n=1 Tax=Hesseltinella vesiculosa TaxID=101127 RepID=A0A1X2GKD5_9FUNG|nr:cytochrome P-450 cyp509A1 [Hesseltinella vesiculosa]